MNGKVAIVTGGAGGLGAAICGAFVREGAAVAVADADLGRARATAAELGTRTARPRQAW